MIPQHNDPIARFALMLIAAVLAGALFVPSQPPATAQAQIIIYPTPTLAAEPLAVRVEVPTEAAPTAIPILPTVEVARIYPATATPAPVEAPPPAVEIASAPETAPASPAPDADPPPLPSFVPSGALEAAGQNYTFATPWPYFGTVSEAILLAQ